MKLLHRSMAGLCGAIALWTVSPRIAPDGLGEGDAMVIRARDGGCVVVTRIGTNEWAQAARRK